MARIVVLGVGIAATLMLALWDCQLVTILAAVTTVMVMIVQFISAGPAVVQFARGDWIRTDQGWRLEVPWIKHQRLSPNVGVWQRRPDDGGLEEVVCDTRTVGHKVVIEINETGDSRFAGEVRIS